MKLTYDAVGDSLYLRTVAPNGTQVVHEVAEGVLVRCNSETGEVEGYEVQGLIARGAHGLDLVLPDAVRQTRRAATG